jgi:hypothetical protein
VDLQHEGVSFELIVIISKKCLELHGHHIYILALKWKNIQIGETLPVMVRQQDWRNM